MKTFPKTPKILSSPPVWIRKILLEFWGRVAPFRFAPSRLTDIKRKILAGFCPNFLLIDKLLVRQETSFNVVC
jgi:phage terminase small subunit